MIHLYKDIWLDADEYQFSFVKKGVYKTGKNVGKEKIEHLTHHSTEEAVSKKIADLGLKNLCNGDYTRAVEVFKETHSNFMKELPKLLKKRYDTR
jgi:hypothetical protein